ncbi:DNA recombination protein RmuC [Flavobacteriaceae bacterium UJ101]|nr:DNA recombination protein RmuC [Flavobacteriaceae bacterium UJ101]
MEQYIIAIISILISILAGFIIGKLFSQNQFNKKINALYTDNQKLSHSNELIETQNKTLQNQILTTKEEFTLLLEKAESEKKQLQHDKNTVEQTLNIQLTQKEATIDHLEDKLLSQVKEYQKLQDENKRDFEILANKILEEKSSKFTEQNKVNIKSLLDPLQEKIQHFEKKVEDTNKESIERNSQLREQIFNLKSLNEQMSKEALNLTKALKGDNKTQGNWGELVLERVLEKSGLEKGREYEVQQSFTNEEGKRFMPDVVINLPDHKKMIVDSKVSLTAYEKYSNEEDEELKEQFLKDHILSLNRHVEQLSEKKYEDLYQIDSPDFVLLFVPIEPAFAIALNTDNQLYNKAFEKNIVIVTPSTLLATLRTIDTMWNNEKQQRNAIEIARQAGALYDKFEGLVVDLTKVGKKMDDAKKDYSAAMNKLVEGRGNLITSVEKLKKLGAKAKKSLPQPFIERAEDEES